MFKRLGFCAGAAGLAIACNSLENGRVVGRDDASPDSMGADASVTADSPETGRDAGAGVGQADASEPPADAAPRDAMPAVDRGAAWTDASTIADARADPAADRPTEPPRDATPADGTTGDARATDGDLADAGPSDTGPDAADVEGPQDAAAPVCSAPSGPRDPPPSASVVALDACTLRGGFVDELRLVVRGLAPIRLVGAAAAVPGTADFDADGDQDIYMSSGSLKLFDNLGNGSFDLPQTLHSAVYAPLMLGRMDVDGDGLSDWLELGGPEDGAAEPLVVYWHRGRRDGRQSLGQPLVEGDISVSRLADADGDGDSDIWLVLGGEAGYLANLGGARFEFQPTGASLTANDTLRDVADVDGDTLPDILSDGGGHLSISRSVAPGVFGQRVVVWPPDDSGGAAFGSATRFADLDGDGLLDIVAESTEPPSIAWFRGLGGGAFDAEPNVMTERDRLRAVRLLDVDADGDLDLYTCGGHGDEFLENTGRGVFAEPDVVDLFPRAGCESDETASFLVDATSDCLPDWFVMPTVGNATVQPNLGGFSFGPPPSRPEDLDYWGFLADFDGDGDLDRLIATREFIDDVPLMAWQRAPGVFDEGHARVPGGTRRVFGTGRGDDDALTDLYVVADGRVALSRNLGGGRFDVPVPVSPTLNLARPHPALVDVDADGRTDVVLWSSGMLEDDRFAPPAWISASHPDTPVSFGTALEAATTVADLTLRDLNADGFLDVIADAVTPVEGQGLIVALNLGNGVFEGMDSARFVPGLSSPMGPGDLDGDGLADLTAYDPVAREYVWLRQGREGEFVAAPLSTGGPRAAGDVDGDGDRDLLTDFSLLLNRGDGQFETPWRTGETYLGLVDLDGDGAIDLFGDSHRWIRGPLTLDGPRPEAVSGVPGGGPLALADVNGDGALDALVALDTGGVIVAFGDGRGAFAPNPIVAAEPLVEALEVRDVTGDAAPDLLLRLPADGGWQILRNDGLGGFDGAPLPLVDGYSAAGLLAFDSEGGGNREFLLCEAGSPPARLAVLGEPPFVASPVGEGLAASSEACAVFDVDADGDMDVAIGDAQGITVRRNDGGQLVPQARLVGFVGNDARLVAGDDDNDGDQDLTLARPSRGQARLYRNPGPAGGGLLQADGPVLSRVRYSDLNGGPPERIVERFGELTFDQLGRSEVWDFGGLLHIPLLRPYFPAFGDVTGDGLPDLLVSERGQPSLLLVRQQPPCAIGVRVGEVP